MIRGPSSVRWPVVGVVLVLAACTSSGDADATASTTSTTSTTSAASAAETSAGSTTAGPPERAVVASAGCGTTPPATPGTTDEHITSGGVERSYQLIVPASYDGTTPHAVVLGLHSLTIDYRVVPGLAGFDDMAASYDFIGVAPSGLLAGGTSPYWNAAPVADNGDLAFLTDLLDHLEATLCVDSARVFSVGMSNGAQMSALLACGAGDRVAAIAPIAGVEHNEPCDGPPVPVIAFHGDADPIVPYEGGGLSSVAIADQNLYHGDVPPGTAEPTGVDESMARWAEHNGCAPEPVEERVSDEVRERTWSGCDAATVLYIVDGGGHAWPGRRQVAFEEQFGPGTDDIDATDLIFRFFFAQGS